MKKIHRGDDGYTDIVRGRVSKDSHVIEFVGSIDELVSFLGIIRNILVGNSNFDSISKNIKNIQIVLMYISSSVIGKVQVIDDFQKHVTDIEKEIELLEHEIKKYCLIIPGSSYESSLLHFARALCRYVERRAVPLLKDSIISKHAYIYLNRLSDLLYLYAVYVDVIRNISIECLS